MRYRSDTKTHNESETKMEEKADTDLDDRGTVFGQYRRMFVILFGIIAVYAVVFLLLTAGVIGLFVADCILIPFTFIIVAVCSRIQKHRR